MSEILKTIIITLICAGVIFPTTLNTSQTGQLKDRVENAYTIEYGTVIDTLTIDSMYVANQDTPWRINFDEFVTTLVHPEQLDPKSELYRNYNTYMKTNYGKSSLNLYESARFSDVDFEFSITYEFDENDQLYAAVYYIPFERDQLDRCFALMSNVLPKIFEHNQEASVGHEFFLNFDRDWFEEEFEDIRIFWSGADDTFIGFISNRANLVGDSYAYIIVGLRSYFTMYDFPNTSQ